MLTARITLSRPRTRAGLRQDSWDDRKGPLEAVPWRSDRFPSTRSSRKNRAFQRRLQRSPHRRLLRLLDRPGALACRDRIHGGPGGCGARRGSSSSARSRLWPWGERIRARRPPAECGDPRDRFFARHDPTRTPEAGKTEPSASCHRQSSIRSRRRHGPPPRGREHRSRHRPQLLVPGRRPRAGAARGPACSATRRQPPSDGALEERFHRHGGSRVANRDRPAVRGAPIAAARFAASMVFWRAFSRTAGRMSPELVRALFADAGFTDIDVDETMGGLGLHCRGRRPRTPS